MSIFLFLIWSVYFLVQFGCLSFIYFSIYQQLINIFIYIFVSFKKVQYIFNGTVSTAYFLQESSLLLYFMISYQQVLPILVIGIGKIHYRSSSSNDGVHSGSQAHVGELCCVLSLDIPVLEKRTRFLTRSSSPRATLDWGEDFTL